MIYSNEGEIFRGKKRAQTATAHGHMIWTRSVESLLETITIERWINSLNGTWFNISYSFALCTFQTKEKLDNMPKGKMNRSLLLFFKHGVRVFVCDKWVTNLEYTWRRHTHTQNITSNKNILKHKQHTDSARE